MLHSLEFKNYVKYTNSRPHKVRWLDSNSIYATENNSEWYVYVSVVPRLKADNQSGDENPYSYCQQNNYIAQLKVKLGSSIEIAQEAASFPKLVASPCVWVFVSNNQCCTFPQSGSRIIEHNNVQICTEMTAVLQIKTCILSKWKLYISCVISVSWNDERNFLWVQSSPESRPPNIDGWFPAPFVPKRIKMANPVSNEDFQGYKPR